MLRPMSMRVVGLVGAALVVALSSSCTASNTTARNRAASSPVPSTPATQLEAQTICEHALHVPVAASASSTVGEVRDFEVGGPAPRTPDPGRRPAQRAFAAAARSDSAAWCTVAAGKTLTFYGAAVNGIAVKLETVNGYSGAVPDHPLAIP
jgi:hypothetical protein